MYKIFIQKSLQSEIIHQIMVIATETISFYLVTKITYSKIQK